MKLTVLKRIEHTLKYGNQRYFAIDGNLHVLSVKPYTGINVVYMLRVIEQNTISSILGFSGHYYMGNVTQMQSLLHKIRSLVSN